MTTLKVGIVLDDSLDRPDGVQQYVKTLGAWLASQGHIVHYLVGQSQPDGEAIHSLSRNIQVRFNKNRLSIPLPAKKRAIQKLLHIQQYDVLHVQMPYNPLLAGRIIAAAHPATAVVGTFHILPYGRFQRIANKTLAVAQKRSLARLDAICSVSSAAKTFAKQVYGIDSQVIPNMIDARKWKTHIQPTPGRIVFLGRLVPRKGCLELLLALRCLPDSLQRHIEVQIAGDGPQRAMLEKFVAGSRLQNVRFLGFVDEQDKPSLLASAELAVFPSLGGESFGIVLIEAMSAGSGVTLGGHNPGYATVLGDWPQTLVNPADTASFADTLQLFLTNAQLRQQLHRRQQQAVKRYDVSVAGAQVVRMYQAALQTRRNVQ